MPAQDLLAARAIAVDDRGGRSILTLDTVIGEGAAVARKVQRRHTQTLFITGALTEEFVDDFTRVLAPGRSLRIVVRDATVLVLPPAGVIRLQRRGIVLEVLTPLRVLAVTTNPFRVPQPYNPTLLFRAIADAVSDRVPVFDVVNGLAAVPAAAAADDTLLSPRKV